MRLLLIAPITSVEADADADLLRLRGYGVTTLLQMMHPTYPHNGGKWGTPRSMHHNMALDLMSGSLCVMHPEAGTDLRHQMVQLCKFLCVPLVRMEELPALPPESMEAIDAINRVADAAMLTGGNAHAAEEQHQRPRLAGSTRECADGPPHTSARTPLAARLLAAWQWAERQLSGLKNPMVRERQQAPLRPYAQDARTLSTTG